MGKWQKGISGNPKGKPPGTKDWRTRLREQLQEAGPDIIGKVLSAARGGDLHAAKIIIDRVIPPLKSASLPITIKIPGNAKLTEQASASFRL